MEHPQEAFSYYRHEGVPHVICEQKHMGSRAVVILCREERVSQRRFGVAAASLGAVYTRTGRRFFNDDATESAFLLRLRDAAETSGLWSELATDWMCLDCELMPWSSKAQELLRQQYAPAGAEATAALPQAVSLLGAGAPMNPQLGGLLEEQEERIDLTQRYVDAYRRHCWPVKSLDDLRLRRSRAQREAARRARAPAVQSLGGEFRAVAAIDQRHRRKCLVFAPETHAAAMLSGAA